LLSGTLDEPFLFDNLEHRETGGSGQRVGDVRRDVEETFPDTVLLDQRVRDRRGEWDAAAERLRDGHEIRDDAIDEVSGAWGGKPDTMLRLEKLDGNRGRLSFPKIRWSRLGTRKALILGFDPETESFSVVAEEEDEERDYAAEIEELLADGTWRITKEIAAPKKDGGIGANVDTIKRELEAHPDRFQSCSGEEAKQLGRDPKATLWQCRTRPSESYESDGVF
jgi:hypothetical protein